MPTLVEEYRIKLADFQKSNLPHQVEYWKVSDDKP